MSDTPFTRKLFSGQAPDDNDWTDYLRKAHEAVPSMSPPVFGAYRTSTGMNSYQILAASLPLSSKPVTVIDLACGDGFFLQYLLPKLQIASKVFAVDMVPSEIEIAKQNYSDSRVQFLCEKAQDLSVQAGAADLVFCHMALMLMLPVEPVVSQLSRALKPGGKLVAIIGGPREPGSICAEMGQLMGKFLKKHFPELAALRMGDERFISTDGLRDLFSPIRGFKSDVEVEDFNIELIGGLDQVWDFYKDMYLVGIRTLGFRRALELR